MLKNILKFIAGFSPVALTKNEHYDRLTERVIQKVCNDNSVCVDVGANKGKILQMMISNCPAAVHYAFEPIPSLYYQLKRKYASACNIYDIALSNKKQLSAFTHVTTDEAYSGLKKRPFDKQEKYELTHVNTDCLDNILPSNTRVTLIKIDVEGAEYWVMQGAQKIIDKWQPYILFEFGKGGSDTYEITPQMMFSFFEDRGYNINLLNHFLADQSALTLDGFITEYEKEKEYFFIAYPLKD